MRTLSEAFSSVFPGQVKAFELLQIEAAREWLANACVPSQDSKFEYRNNSNNNIVEITVEGKITEADFEDLLQKAKADFKKHGKLRVLEEVRSFEGIDPMALWKDIQGIPYVKDVTHAAIVADAKWMQTMAEAVGAVIPAQIKAFELSQIQEAREWLLNAPESSHDSKIEYRNNSDNNIVEITIEGLITAADFDRVISQMKADFKKHEKLCILEEIRSFEGIDPMALWQDIQFGLPHINDIARVAVVTDMKWIQTFSSAIDNILDAEVKAFDLSQIESARKWLASA
ncbi:MAG: STAS/SEC14 domain-containing protein [Richelia sp. RM2_1_2]|nr:STAS/SEC14 domain-containing protein [Richelia sp. RM1_1_1]NJO60378.1 STAS/SEC14 domain-containing protein [Richelia sp. RM2_1_2]